MQSQYRHLCSCRHQYCLSPVGQSAKAEDADPFCVCAPHIQRQVGTCVAWFLIRSCEWLMHSVCMIPATCVITVPHTSQFTRTTVRQASKRPWNQSAIGEDQYTSITLCSQSPTWFLHSLYSGLTASWPVSMYLYVSTRVTMYKQTKNRPLISWLPEPPTIAEWERACASRDGAPVIRKHSSHESQLRCGRVKYIQCIGFSILVYIYGPHQTRTSPKES